MKKGVLYTIGATIILVICFIAFVLPSSLGDQRSQEGIVFGKYNGKKIAYEYGSDFAQTLSNYANYYSRMGIQIDNSNQFYIFNEVFNACVRKYAYEDYLKKAGYTVPEEAVNRQLRTLFYDENGKFSAKLFNQADSATVANYKKSIEDSVKQTRFADDNFGSTDDVFGTTALYGLKESDSEMNFLAEMGAEKRGFDMAVFKKGDYPESEKLKFAVANSGKFVKYDLSVLTFDDKSTADKFANRIKKNEITFEDAVDESNKTYSNSEGKIISNMQYQVENILNDKADLAKISDLKSEEISPVIQTMRGYSIFKADGSTEQPDFTNAATLEKASNYLYAYEATIIEDYFVAKANDFTTAAMNTSFQAACTAAGCENVSVPAFPLNYGSSAIADKLDSSIASLNGADTNDDFLKTAFGLKLNELSKPLVLDDYVVVLKYTSTENTAAEDKAFGPEIENMDSNSAGYVIMNSPKLENNFINAYYTKIIGNN